LPISGIASKEIVGGVMLSMAKAALASEGVKRKMNQVKT